MRDLRSGARLQLLLYRSNPDVLIPLLTSPLYMIIFTMIFSDGGRPSLAGYGIIAPFYMSLWWFALVSGGLVIQSDRWQGVLEYQTGTPASFFGLILGRISAITIPSLAAFAETFIFARYALGLHIVVHHWLVFAASFLLTLFAMVGTALLMTSAFAFARNAFTFANTATFPVYLLAGILVPVALLPGWLQPVSKMVFLSWSATLLRGSLYAAPMQSAYLDLLVLTILGCAALLAGFGLLRLILTRLRRSGELGLL